MQKHYRTDDWKSPRARKKSCEMKYMDQLHGISLFLIFSIVVKCVFMENIKKKKFRKIDFLSRVFWWRAMERFWKRIPVAAASIYYSIFL